MLIAHRPSSFLSIVNTVAALRQGGLLMAAMLVAGIVSAFVLKQDVNWDLQNYHFYNAWAFLRQRLGWDIAPAQLQTYHNPLLDLPFYWMIAADWPPRLISFVMGLPAGIGAFFLGKILHTLFGDLSSRDRWLYAALAFLIGITASGPVSQLGTTLNEWPGTALVMIALWLVLKRAAQGEMVWHLVVAAGLLCGIASGLKLTAATFAVGLCVALLWQRPVFWVGFRYAFGFGLAVLVGVFLTLGHWMWTLYIRFGNPLFPYFNDVFHSPWWDQAPLVQRTFGPHTLLEWLTFPLRLLKYTSSFVAEVPFRDWRLALLYVFAIAALIAWVVRQIRNREQVASSPSLRAAWRLLIVFWGASFALWAAMHSIYRYLLPLELLSGALMVYLLRSWIPWHWLPIATTVAAALAIFSVRYPDWWRSEYAQHYFEVKVPPVEARAVVLLIGGEPMAYVLPFFPPDGRFLGALNNFNDPQRRNRLAYELDKVVRDHDGPLYSLSLPAGAAPQILQAHRLRRIDGGCTRVETNMLTSPIELCRLERSDGAGTKAPRLAG